MNWSKPRSTPVTCLFPLSLMASLLSMYLRKELRSAQGVMNLQCESLDNEQCSGRVRSTAQVSRLAAAHFLRSGPFAGMVTARASLKAEATTREAAARLVCGVLAYEPLFRRLHDCEFELAFLFAAPRCRAGRPP